MNVAEFMTNSLSAHQSSVVCKAINGGGCEVFVPGYFEPILVPPGKSVAIATRQVGGNHSVPLHTIVARLEP